MAFTPDLAGIEERLFSLAKKWFASSVCLRCASAGTGLLALNPYFAPVVPFAVAAIAAVAEGCSLRSDLVKSRADRLLRMRELRDGLGWDADMTALADVLAVTPTGLDRGSDTRLNDGFASRQPVGAERAFENLRESAWWTQHLALTMFKGTAALVTVLLAASVIALVASAAGAWSTPSRVAVARVVTALFVVVFSAGLVKLMYAYWLLYDRAKQAVARVNGMRTADPFERRLAVVYEYQNARSSGPLIPDFVYLCKRARLNQLWQLQVK